MLDVMKVKWWTQKRGGGTCMTDDSGKGSTGTALTLANVGGVFVVLLGGIACSWFIGVIEFIWRSRRTDATKRVRFLNFNPQKNIFFSLGINIILTVGDATYT